MLTEKTLARQVWTIGLSAVVLLAGESLLLGWLLQIAATELWKPVGYWTAVGAVALATHLLRAIRKG